MTGSAVGLADGFFLYTDTRGSVVMSARQNGSNTTVNSYDEYGVPGSGNTGRFGYTGQTWVSELGMWHYKARMYSPTLGRFMQTDPIGYGDGMNMYAYVGGDPVNGVDPSGMICYRTTSIVQTLVLVGDVWQPNDGDGDGKPDPPGESSSLVGSCGLDWLLQRSMRAFGGGGYPGGGGGGGNPEGGESYECDFGRRLAGDLAKGFSDLSTVFWAADVAAGIATIVSAAAEVPTIGGSTPITFGLGSATVSLAAIALGTGVLSAGLQSYANSGDPSSLLSLGFSEWTGNSIGDKLRAVPGLGRYASLLSSLAGQAAALKTTVETQCSGAL